MQSRLILSLSALAFMPGIGPISGPFLTDWGCVNESAWGTSVCNDGNGVSVNETRTEVDPAPYSGDPYHYDDTQSGPVDPADPGHNCIRIDDGRCFNGVFPTSPADPGAPAPPVITTVTSRDLADFTPAAATLRMEPGGWAILDQPANFWVDASPHQQHGTLFGRPVTIDFAPSSVRWDFGDGNAWTTDTTGASWADLGMPELTSTATSNIYTQRGRYTVTATIRWSAIVHIDGRTIRVTGDVTTTATSVEFELYEQKTVLVRP